MQSPPDSGTFSSDNAGDRRPADDPEIAQRFTADPFIVLQAPATASRRELDAAAAELLAELARGGASRYPTALGERLRDADLVERARHEVRDAEVRILHEVWARLPTRRSTLLVSDRPAPWRGGEAALGWRRR